MSSTVSMTSSLDGLEDVADEVPGGPAGGHRRRERSSAPRLGRCPARAGIRDRVRGTEPERRYLDDGAVARLDDVASRLARDGRRRVGAQDGRPRVTGQAVAEGLDRHGDVGLAAFPQRPDEAPEDVDDRRLRADLLAGVRQHLFEALGRLVGGNELVGDRIGVDRDVVVQHCRATWQVA